MPENVTEARRDPLAYASFRILPPNVPPTTEDLQRASYILALLKDGEDNSEPPLALQLEQRFVERLVPRVGIPLEVRSILPRRGSIELGVLILGSYALLKDYKTLRESLNLLVEDIRNVFEVPGGQVPRRLPDDWQVTLEDVRTPGTTVSETFGGFVGMGGLSRYALVYFLAITINVLVLIFFCYLTLITVWANT